MRLKRSTRSALALAAAFVVLVLAHDAPVRGDVFLGLVTLAVGLWAGRPRHRSARGRPRSARLRGVSDYDRYMGSATWRRKRALCIAAAGGICQTRDCAAPAQTAHHPDYRRLFHERQGDLVALCWPCHRAIHTRHRRLLATRWRVSLRQVTYEHLTRQAA